MRMSDWSSDVCSSDLGSISLSLAVAIRLNMKEALHASIDRADLVLSPVATRLDQAERWLAASGGALDSVIAKPSDEPYHQGERAMRKVKQLRNADCGVGRSGERRGGKECVSTCRSGGGREHEKKKN